MTDIYVTVETQHTAAVTAVGIQGLSAADFRIDDLVGVSAAGKVEGSVLVYSVGSSAWTATTMLDKQNIEGGHY